VATHFLAKVNSIRAVTASAPVPDIEPRSIPCLSDYEVVTTRRHKSWRYSRRYHQNTLPWSRPYLVGQQSCGRSSTETCDRETATQETAARPGRRKLVSTNFESDDHVKVGRSSVSSQRDVWSTLTISERQPAYRHLHSTATANRRSLYNDLVCAAAVELVYLTPVALFDTVDHNNRLSVLGRRFCVESIALRWFRAYLKDRTEVFVVSNANSSSTYIVWTAVCPRARSFIFWSSSRLIRLNFPFF